MADYIHLHHTAANARFRARVQIAMAKRAAARFNAQDHAPGERQLIRRVLDPERSPPAASVALSIVLVADNLAPNLITNAVSANTTDGVVDYDAVSDAITDANLTAALDGGVWALLLRG